MAESDPSTPPISTDRPGPALLSGSAREIADLRNEVGELKAKWKKENEGVIGWIKKWGAVIGLCAGLIAVPKGAYELYGVVVSKPNTSAMRGLPISMSYDATTETMRFSFNVSVHNSGNADDTITELWATFVSPESSGIPAVTFDSSKFIITDKNDNISLPFTIPKGISRDLAFKVESPLESKSIPDYPGNWAFMVKLNGQGQVSPITIQYHLFLPADDIAELKKSGLVLKFMNAD
jgi:hypothetical protein